jgi:AcrR family transcriptional regulator
MARPRSARAHTEVLDAAQSLFADRGIDGTSMDAIAHASGVSKATIYKHWPDKDALCLEVMVRIHGRDEPAPDFDSGDLRADLIAALSHQPPARYSTLRERIMPHLIAYSARNPAFSIAWRTRAIQPVRTQLRAILQRGIESGTLPRDLSIDVAIALLFGPMAYGWILKMLVEPLPANLPELVVDAFVRAHRIGRPAGPRRRGTGRDAGAGAGTGTATGAGAHRRVAATPRATPRPGRRASRDGRG